MLDGINIVVYGLAQPAGSKRAFLPKGSRRPSIVDANKKSRPWKTQVSQAAGQQYSGELLRGPLAVQFKFYVPRPKHHYGSGRNASIVKNSAPTDPTSKPDLLKLARGVEDALTGVVYGDDSQIVHEHLFKQYGSPARVEIFVQALDGRINATATQQNANGAKDE